jgi:tRNA (guanine-N7-)-methyltransferase
MKIDDNAAASEGAPRRKFYGRRKGRQLRKGQRALIDDLLPRLAVVLPRTGETESVKLDPTKAFAPPPREIWLEIGFGGGEHLAQQAKTHPEIGFIGCEVFENGVASMLAHIRDEDLTNVRIHPEDARDLLAVLQPRSIGRLFLMFPDPWPKKRHAARRFINRDNLDRLAELLADGAEFRVGSDDPNYIAWTLAHVTAHPAFQWLAESPADWRRRPADWPETRYERKALLAGRKPAYLRFHRRRR